MENERSAAGIHAGISSQIFGASLVLIGILLGYLDIKEIPFGSVKGVLIFSSILCLLLSLIIAGKGLQKLRDEGTLGNWDLKNLHKYFRAQTILNLAAILLFFIIITMDNLRSKQDLYEERVMNAYETNLRYDSLKIEQGKINIALLQQINAKLDSLKPVAGREKHRCRQKKCNGR